MNILHIVSAKVWGGGEQYVYNVCKEEKLRGNEVFVVIDKRRDLLNSFKNVGTILAVNLTSFKFFSSSKVIAKFIRENNIQIVNIHSGRIGFLGLLLKRKLGKSNLKIIMYRHNLTANKKDLYHKYLRSKIDAFICVSKAVYKVQKQTIENKQAHKVKLVYNGIDLKRFPKINKIKRPNEFVVGFAGRIVEEKGVLLLLEAVAILINNQPNLKLKLIGQVEIEFKEKLKTIIKEKNIENNVEIINYTKDLNEFYRSLDIFVLPSIVKEAFGLVICEAMACEIPVIATNSGAQEEIITNGKNGLIINANKEELVKAIEILSKDKELYLKITREGLKTVKNRFTIKACVDGIHRVYNSL